MQPPEAKKYSDVLVPVCLEEQLLGDIRCQKKPFGLAGHSEHRQSDARHSGRSNAGKPTLPRMQEFEVKVKKRKLPSLIKIYYTSELL